MQRRKQLRIPLRFAQVRISLIPGLPCAIFVNRRGLALFPLLFGDLGPPSQALHPKGCYTWGICICIVFLRGQATVVVHVPDPFWNLSWKAGSKQIDIIYDVIYNMHFKSEWFHSWLRSRIIAKEIVRTEPLQHPLCSPASRSSISSVGRTPRSCHEAVLMWTLHQEIPQEGSEELPSEPAMGRWSWWIQPPTVGAKYDTFFVHWVLS